MMEKLVDAVMRNLPKTRPATNSVCYTRKCVERRLRMMFPVFETPDHPPYSLMIEQAIAKLKEEGGSSEDSISKCITLEYNSLPWAHTSLLSHHLRKLRDCGEIVYTCHDRYMLPFDGKGSVPPALSKEKLKKGRGRKSGMHVQSKKLKRETLLESRNPEVEHKMNRRSYREFKADFRPGMQIDMRDSELAAKENTQVLVKGNELGSLSQGPQCQGTRGANQAAEKINDEPMVEQVQGSEEQPTVAEQMPMQQELHCVDHDESDKQRIQQHDVILAHEGQVKALPVSVEDTEQSLADSESRSRIVEESPRQSQVDDFSARRDYTENQNKVNEGQSEKSRLLEVHFKQILMRQKEIGELVKRLKQLTEASENVLLPRDKFMEVLRRNREIRLGIQEMLKASPESSSNLFNQTLHKGRAGVPSKDLSTIGDGVAGVRFSLHQCQKQDNFIPATGTSLCAEWLPLFSNFCPRRPDEVAKDSGDLSCGEQKQPELSNRQTQSHERGILLHNSGGKLLDRPYMCVVALPAPGCSEKISKQHQPHHRSGQQVGTESRVFPPQVQDPGLNSRTNEVPPSVSIGERACPDELMLQHNHHLEQELELSKSQNGGDGSVKDSGFSAERIKEYPAVSNEHEDLTRGRLVAEPPEKLLKLPIPEGAEELSWKESQQTVTKWMTKMGNGFFPAEQPYSAQQTVEQPPQNTLERDNTIAFATSLGSPASLTSSDLASPKKRYRKCDKLSVNLEYREKLRSRNLSNDPIPMNPCSEGAKDTMPLVIAVSPGIDSQCPLPGMLTERERNALTSENSSPSLGFKKRRGRPPMPMLP